MGDGMKRGVGDDPFADDVSDDVTDESQDTVMDDSQPTSVEASSRDGGDEFSFSGDVAGALETIETGEASTNISVRDRDMKALLLALEENYEARYNVTDALDLEEDAPRSDIVRKLLREGLQEAAPVVHEELGEGVAKHARDSL